MYTYTYKNINRIEPPTTNRKVTSKTRFPTTYMAWYSIQYIVNILRTSISTRVVLYMYAYYAYMLTCLLRIHTRLIRIHTRILYSTLPLVI